MPYRSRPVPNDRTKINLSHLANTQCIYSTQTDTAYWFFSDSDTMQTSTEKEYRDGRRRCGEADWSCRPATATRGPCRRPARTFLVTSLDQHLFSPIRFGGATAFPRSIEHMPSEIRMETGGLHAYFDAQAATSSGATWGSAKPTTRRRPKSRCADPAKRGTLVRRPNGSRTLDGSRQRGGGPRRAWQHTCLPCPAGG